MVTVKFPVRDRAGRFAGSFDAVLTAEGTRILASPPQAPRANAICERITGTLRRELPGRLLTVSEQHLLPAWHPNRIPEPHRERARPENRDKPGT